MRFYISSINTQILHIRILADTFKQLLEFFVFLPLRKPFVHCLPRTLVFRKITPGSPGVHDPENSIQEFAVIRLRSSGFLWCIAEKRFDLLPLYIINFISSCHLCAPLDYLCRNHIIHDTSDFCKILFDLFQTIEFGNTP